MLIAFLEKQVGHTGLEPVTLRLRSVCSTVELMALWVGLIILILSHFKNNYKNYLYAHFSGSTKAQKIFLSRTSHEYLEEGFQSKKLGI